MTKQDKLQQILDLVSEFTDEFEVSAQKKKEAFNSIYSLGVQEIKVEKKTAKRKKRAAGEPDIYDICMAYIKEGSRK
jgi:hypothetical protein